MQAVVVGSGIIGSSLALQLAKRGCKCTVIDPAPCSGATAASWAWLNANKKNPRHYKELNMKGMEEWYRSFPHLAKQCGVILLDDAAPSTDPTYPCQPLNQEQLLQREPGLSPEALVGRPAHFYAQEGWADPHRSCSYFLDEARKLGMQYLPEAAQHLLTYPEQASPKEAAAKVVGVRTSSGREVTGDVVVLACGPAVQGLAAQAGVHVPMLHRPARVTITSGLPQLLNAMICDKDIFVMQRPDGTFMLGEPFENMDEDVSAAVGEAMLARATQLVPALQDVKVTAVQLGFRPYPKDGHPVVGQALPGLYICTTHSGMTLATHLTKLAACEIVGEGLADDLAPYRPQREFGNNNAYAWELYGKAPAAGQAVKA